MDDPSQENIKIETNWVFVDPVDFAEEAIVLDAGLELQKKTDLVESDLESDGISIISESSHLHESTTDDDHFQDSEHSEEISIKKEIQESEENMSHSGSVTWTFVNSEVPRPESPLSENSSKQFYLNCLQEPVQELSEHELGSIQSDLESDSISIISECESLDENNQLPLEVRTMSMDNAKLQIVSKNPIHKYFNGLMIGTILLASSSIFLGQYFNINDFISDITASGNDVPGKYNVPTILSFCKNKHKTDDIKMQYNINKCITKIEKRLQKKKNALKKSEQVQNMEKHLKIKEQYLGEKEKFLIKKEYELLKVEIKLKKQHLKRFQKNNVQKRLDVDTVADIILSQTKHEKMPDSSLKSRGENEIFQKNVHESKKNLKYDKEKSSKPKYSQNNEKAAKIIGSNTNEWKFKDMKDSSLRNDKHTKKREKCNKHTLKKQSKNIHEEENVQNYVILDNGSNETVSGYWVGKLYKARSDLRNKEHLGDWYFDRASYRKKKRDKAGWYFDWMMDREVLRYKRSYYI